MGIHPQMFTQSSSATCCPSSSSTSVQFFARRITLTESVAQEASLYISHGAAIVTYFAISGCGYWSNRYSIRKLLVQIVASGEPTLISVGGVTDDNIQNKPIDQNKHALENTSSQEALQVIMVRRSGCVSGLTLRCVCSLCVRLSRLYISALER